MSAGSLRIAMIGQRGLPATYGGVEHHVEELSTRLVRRGHEVTVYCRRSYSSTASGEYRGVKLKRVPTISTRQLDALVHSGTSTLATLGTRYDIIHYHAVGPGVFSPAARALTGARIVQTIHGLDGDRAKWGRRTQLFWQGATWMSARVPHTTVVVSRALGQYYFDRLNRETVYIANGVNDPGDPPPRQLLRRWGLEDSDYLLFVGRLVPEKAPDLLVRAFSSIPGNMRLVLAGGDAFARAYERSVGEAAARDPRVVMTGYVYGESLSALYANAMAYVLPSSLEGLPLTLLEAASFGVPVVASDIPPHVEVLGHDRPGARLFRSGSVEDLTSAILRSVACRQDEKRGAETLRKEILGVYSWDDAVVALEGVYIGLVGESGRLDAGLVGGRSSSGTRRVLLSVGTSAPLEGQARRGQGAWAQSGPGHRSPDIATAPRHTHQSRLFPVLRSECGAGDLVLGGLCRFGDDSALLHLVPFGRDGAPAIRQAGRPS
jgi:glycosyltransferase involved in cell wall biosynthesis